MLFKQSIVSLLSVYTSVTAASQLQYQHEESTLNRLRCGAVNFMVTAFLPQAHATALCSAYLQVPEKTYTSTATLTASASTITETTNQLIPTSTKFLTTTYLTTSTTTIDSWIGKPACSTIPTFDWVRRNRDSFKPIESLLEQACGCLAVPASTRTVLAFTSTTPVSTITEGVRGEVTVTSTVVEVAVETRTKLIHLIDRSNEKKGNDELVDAGVQIGLPIASEVDFNRSGLGNFSEIAAVRRSAPLLGSLNLVEKMGLSVLS